MLKARHLAPLIALTLLAGCVRLVPQGAAPLPENAALLGARLAALPPLAGAASADLSEALDSFAASCPVARRREDQSGLTQVGDWEEACTAATAWPRHDAAAFFSNHFQAVRVGDGAAFATGYFEPEIAGSRTPRPGFGVPVYALPDDLVRAWPDDLAPASQNGQPPLGRYDERGRFGPYFDRAEIEHGALAGRGLEIAWAADPVEFFFLQIQGSGRLRTPEGEVIRIGYAGQNGHAYTGIGGLLRERGLLGSGPGQYAGSMQGIMQYIRDHPAQGAALMRENRSWVFFRELSGAKVDEGPIGSIGVPVRGEVSVAVDPRFVPYGAPVILTTDRAEANRLWIAQDTGGAIRGPNRFDTFWGAGDRARFLAGGMSARGSALVLLPTPAAARLAQARVSR